MKRNKLTPIYRFTVNGCYVFVKGEHKDKAFLAARVFLCRKGLFEDVVEDAEAEQIDIAEFERLYPKAMEKYNNQAEEETDEDYTIIHLDIYSITEFFADIV